MNAAKYENVAEAIRAKIRRGELHPGDMLPGNRVLADQHKVSLGTAQKAVHVLQSEGWLSTTPAVGVFVNEPPTESPSAANLADQMASLKDALEQLTERVARLEAS